ncbi:MAG: hypothetical protein NT029_08380 [Armatimonadetes bacterium]|nr:hypothetical protein [Armatimonadota bacterium]
MKSRTGLLALASILCLSALVTVLAGCGEQKVSEVQKQAKVQKKDK